MSNLNQPFIFPGKHPNVLSAMQKQRVKQTHWLKKIQLTMHRLIMFNHCIDDIITIPHLTTIDP